MIPVRLLHYDVREVSSINTSFPHVALNIRLLKERIRDLNVLSPDNLLSLSRYTLHLFSSTTQCMSKDLVPEAAPEELDLRVIRHDFTDKGRDYRHKQV